MALFPTGGRAEYNGAVGKTHTNLVVSEGVAPAEKYLVSRTNMSSPFIYEFGPEGNQTVLIAKGKIVEAVGEELNRETGFRETAIRVAQEDSERAIGVNHHNIYEQTRGGMNGNRGTVIQSNYIEVPLFEHETVATAAGAAEAMRFGAAYGQTKDLMSGDYVVSGVDGNFKKFIKGTHDFSQVVGQALNVTREMPPAGLLQYYTGLKASELDEYLKAAGQVPGAVDSIKPYGAPYTNGGWKPEFVEALAGGKLTGIPFLTDGYFSAKQTLQNVALDSTDVEAVRPGDGASVDGKNIVVEAGITETLVAVKIAHKLDPRELDNVSVQYDASELADGSDIRTLSKRDVRVDEKNNTIVFYLDGAAEATTFANVELTVPAVVNPTAGIPTEWDYAGSVGAARIKLLK